MPKLKSDRLSREAVISINSEPHQLRMSDLKPGDYFTVPSVDSKVRQTIRSHPDVGRVVGGYIHYVVISSGMCYATGTASSTRYGIESNSLVRRIIPTRMDFQWED